MRVVATCGYIDQVTRDLIVVNLFKGVQYPGGATGAIDKALNHQISRLIREEKITGELGEVSVVETSEFVSPYVFVVGLGNSQLFKLKNIDEINRKVIEEALKRDCQSLATIVHGGGAGGLDYPQAVEVLVRSAYDLLKDKDFIYDIVEASENKFEILMSVVRELSKELNFPFEERRLE